ncbi:MAG: CPBP family intramembrane metalloprotease [Prevotella sp.]|nr:CPBP family intramembrane metalloprotease [Candidatus Equicola stercoris]
MKKILLTISILIAALLWFLMFSPWTAPHINFWYMMTASAVILIILSQSQKVTELKSLKDSPLRPFRLSDSQTPQTSQTSRLSALISQLLIGIAIAVFMWVVFYVGDKMSQWMFDFARPQVDTIYGMKGTTSPIYIAIALLLIIGPAEELFWRGYVQERMQTLWGKNVGFIVATLVYTLIHIWSFNFMLIMAALVCGVCWGFIYRLDRRLLPALVVSHALWDACAFVFIPF